MRQRSIRRPSTRLNGRALGISLACVALAAAACSSSSNSGGAAASSTGTIAIGAEMGLTGADTTVGVPQLDGIKLAIDQLNAKGIKIGKTKYTIQLTAEDDASTPTTGVEVVQKIIGANIHFMLGILSSDVVQAYLPIISKQSDLISIASGCALPSLTGTSNVFRSASPTTEDTALDLNMIKEKGWKTIGIFTDRTHAGYVEETRVEDAQLAKLGVKIVDSEEYTVGDTQYGAQLTRMLAQHPQVIDLRGYAADALRIIIQARQLGYTGPFITTAGLDPTEVVQENAAKYMSQVYNLSSLPSVQQVASATTNGPLGHVAPATAAAAKSMGAAYQAKFGQPAGLLSGYSYGTVYMLIQAMKDAGTTTNIPAIESALNKLKLSQLLPVLPEPFVAGPGDLLFSKRDTLSPGSVGIWKDNTFVAASPLSTSYAGVTR
jgi:branched-chain amino acid transport system substrate-binding protein